MFWSLSIQVALLHLEEVRHADESAREGDNHGKSKDACYHDKYISGGYELGERCLYAYCPLNGNEQEQSGYGR